MMMLRRLFPRFALLLIIGATMLMASRARAGWIEDRDGKTIIHLKLFSLPDPTRTDPPGKAAYAVVKAFVDGFPQMFRERYAAEYKANPERYGDHNWDNVEIELHRFSGIQVEGQAMDSGPLMAIAGGVSPDIIYVNFRQSDTYIQEGFLYPLDEYVAKLTPAERDFQFHPKTRPVVQRKGPGGEVKYWAKPTGGILGRVMLYRKDLLDLNGIPHPQNDWTWEDLYWACRKISNPQKGVYGIAFGKGKAESWYWVTFLWSAGGEAMEYFEENDEWRATFNSRQAAVAVDYYTRLCAEKWIDDEGKTRYGYAAMEATETSKWELGQIGFMAAYIDEKLFSTINPDLVGMVPVPLGAPDPETGERTRGAELNSRMQGIFSGVKEPAIRDAAWEYMRFVDSEEGVRISTRIMVEGGLGRFVNPRYLKMFGYDDIVRLAPPGWSEIFAIAIETGKPEPYGRNCQLVYDYMTGPLVVTRDKAKKDELPELDRAAVEAVFKDLDAYGKANPGDDKLDEIVATFRASLELPLISRISLVHRDLAALLAATDEPATELVAVRDRLQALLDENQAARLAVIQVELDQAVAIANEKMIGLLTPDQKLVRRSVAAVVLVIIAAAFAFLFRKIIKTFTPPSVEHSEKKEKWGFRKYSVAYLIILPAVLSILLWQYVPLGIGSAMAFQNFRIVGESTWVGIDNFANLLWDGEWWLAVWNAFRYSLLVISLTFLPPVILAVLLDEIPKGKILFRTIFYLPAVITGLVVIYLWRSFYEPNEFGVLNAIVMVIPAYGYILIGIGLFMIMFFFAKRLWVHQSYWQGWLCLVAGLALFWFAYAFADTIFDKREGVSRWAGLSFAMLAAIMVVYACAAYFLWNWLAPRAGLRRTKLLGLVTGIGYALVATAVFYLLLEPLSQVPLMSSLFLTQQQPYEWLSNEDTAMLCCVIPMVWAGMGPGCLIYLAALKGIAPDFYEAADIDGATFIDKILFIVIPILKPLLIIQFVGVFIASWNSSAFILAMTGGAHNTEVAGLHIFYKAYLHLKFGPAAAMAWMLGFMLIGFTVHQLRILSRLEFKTTGNK